VDSYGDTHVVRPSISETCQASGGQPMRPFPSMLASVASATLSGAVGRAVSVEVHVSNGLPGFTIVGLPDAAVREAGDRVRAAVLSSGLPWPLLRVTVNLAPSSVQNVKRAKPLRGRRSRVISMASLQHRPVPERGTIPAAN
jgi:hypothetical protein